MNVVEVKHPLIEHKVGILREKGTGTKEFRELAGEITEYLCYEAMRDAETYEVEIETPLEKTLVKRINEDRYLFLPILRAGIGMAEGITKVIPNAKIGTIGMYRNEVTLEPVEYYYKVSSDIVQREVIILDPMLATGGSISDAIQRVKKDGVKKIKCLCIIAAPEGIKAVTQKHTDVEIYCAKIDRCLDENGYIRPGLGDAGDRIFGVK